MTKFLLILFVTKLFIPLALISQTNLTFKQFNVNGFKTFLINTRQGNMVTLAFNVDAGSLHDDPIRHAGRAHLWEHYIHRGSTRFPNGRQKIAELSTRIGGSRNAGTSASNILYYFNMHPDAFTEVSEVLGAMISGPNWDPQQFNAEKLTVMNEALEYQSNFQRSTLQAIFLEALPPGHPFKMYNIGTQEQLKNMTIDDIKDLYYSTYTPEASQIIVVGNFDSLPSAEAPLNETRVLEILNKNFFPPTIKNDPGGYSKVTSPLNQKVIPSIVDSESDLGEYRIVEFKKPSEQMSLYQLVFEIPENVVKINPDALEILMDFLNQDVSGSLQNYLKEQGLIFNLGGYYQTINNLSFLVFSFTLSEKGEQLKHRIVDYLFAYLHKIKNDGFDDNVLEHLKMMNINSYTNASKKTNTIAGFFYDFYKRSGKNALNFEKRYGAVSSAEIMEIASRAFDPEKMIGGYFGPDIQSQNLSSVFLFPFNKIETSQLIWRWKRILEYGSLDINLPDKVQLPDIRLNFDKKTLSGTNKEARVLKKHSPGIDLILREQHVSPTGAVLFKMILPPQNISFRTKLEIFTIAFNKRYSSELELFQSAQLLGSANIVHNLKVDYYGLNLFFSGNRGPHEFLFNWFTNELKKFEITPDEFEYAKNILRLRAVRKQNDFSAMIALDGAFSLLLKNDFSTQDISETAQVIDPQELKNFGFNAFKNVDLMLVASGDYNSEYILNLISKFEKIFPERLSDDQRKNVLNHLVVPKKNVSLWVPLSMEKENGAIGIVDIYKVKSLTKKEQIALKIFSKTLHQNVFYLNREVRGLGYVQGAYSQILKNQGFLGIYGQTDKKENWKELVLGIEYIIKMASQNRLRTNEFSNEKTGIFRADAIIPSRDEILVERMFQDFRAFGDPNHTSKIVKFSKDLTPEEIYAVGNKILALKTPSVSVYATKELYCKSIFTSISEAKKKLSGNAP